MRRSAVVVGLVMMALGMGYVLATGTGRPAAT